MAATRTKKRYLLCVQNKGCEDLEPRKLYEQLPDPRAAEDGHVRVVDESGEDALRQTASLSASSACARVARAAAPGGGYVGS